MNIKIRRPQSCLGCLGWAMVALITFVLLHNVYAQVRIYLAREQAMELAQQLGYTPDDFLRSGVDPVGDLLSVTAVCSTVVYFVTPLELPDFEARLLAAQPGTYRILFASDRSGEIYADLPLSRNGVRGNDPNAETTFRDIFMDAWDLPGKGRFVTLYQTRQVEAALAYGERPITDNIAIINQSAGSYPLWVRC